MNDDDEHDSLTPRRRAGRPPKYDWGDKRDICYRLYVEEQRSAASITKYFAQHFDVDPSELPCRKGFLRQFQQWGFPSHTKKLTPDEEAAIVARIRELWELSTPQKDIKRALVEEGWEVRSTQFTALWSKYGFRLRQDGGFKPPDPNKPKQKRKRSGGAQRDGHNALDTLDLIAELGAHIPGEASNGPIAAPMGPEQIALRNQRLLEIQLESDQRMQSRKRRRRIRGYGHLPPDAPGMEPRYGSETSLDECKAFLHLSNDMYTTIRKHYTAICEELGIIKKTLCAEGVWEQSKDRLIRENLHLSAQMHPLQPDQDKKANALDCLCSDVTKRMRVAGKTITIAEANNVLGINPSESKAIRRSLYEILAADNFESKFVSGEDHWASLRQQWFATNATLQQTVTENDPEKMKGVELLCKDSLKRFREDKNKRGERQIVQKNAHYGPGPGPAWSKPTPRSKKGAEERAANGGKQIRPSRVRNEMENSQYPPQDSGNLMPTLASGNMNFDLDPALTIPGPFVPHFEPSPASQPIPAYFRLAPTSNLVGHHPKIWLGKLTSLSIPALHRAATCKAGAATVMKIHGVLKNGDGTEDSWLIENQEELEVYLQESAEKASFSVLLQGGYA